MFFVEYSFEELAQKMAEEIQRDGYEKAKKEIEDELRGKGATDIEIAQELKKYDEDNNRTKNSEIKEIKQRFINEAMKNATRKVTVEESPISEEELEENRRKASMEIGAERYSGVEIYGAPIIETQRRMGINRNSAIQALRERYLAYKRSNAVSDYTIQADEVMFSNMARMIHSLNASGVAMKYKLLGLENSTAKKEASFKKGIQRRIELICNIFSIMGSSFDYRSIEIVFTRNLPANIEEIANLLNQIGHLLSKQTQLSLLPFDIDFTAEQARIEAEDEQGYDGYEELLGKQNGSE